RKEAEARAKKEADEEEARQNAEATAKAEEEKKARAAQQGRSKTLMGLVETLLKRKDSLDTLRDKWVPLWKELAEYILPRKGFGLEPGSEATQRIMDSTPTDAMVKYCSVIVSLLGSDFEVRA
ncbi:Head-to-tail connector protein, podovirus-type like protein, partial [Aduncisulcus paluster]